MIMQIRFTTHTCFGGAFARFARHFIGASHTALAATMVCASLLTVSAAAAGNAMPRNGDPVIFASVAPGTPLPANPSGLGISGAFVNGVTFRVTEPTQISRLGAYLDSNGGSVYLGLYKLETPKSVLDAVADSDLLAATVASSPVGGGDTHHDMSVTVQPGWYAIGVGTGRNGATTTSGFMPSFSTDSNSNNGTYSIRTSDNHFFAQSAEANFYVLGHTAAAAPANSGFETQTASPAAHWSQASTSVDRDNHIATRFHVDATVHVSHVSAWMHYGSGTVFAALVHLPTASAEPESYDSVEFASSLVGTTLIATGGAARDYAGNFDDLELTPGDYALILGSGRFGASGEANLMEVDDEIINPGSLWWTQNNGWLNLSNRTFHITLRGDVPRLSIAPDPLDFPLTAIGSQSPAALTLTNHGDHPLALGGGNITGSVPGAYFLTDTSNCLTSVLAAGSQCNFSVTYAPTTAATHHATLRVNSNGAPVPLAVPITGSSPGLAVSVDNQTDYVAYGHSLTYVVTVANNGTASVGNVEVTLNWPPQMDATSAVWSCAETAHGCTASGTGNIDDSGINLAPTESVSYTITVPVNPDAVGDTVNVRASATTAGIGPFDSSDLDTLVIFRNSFE